MSEQIRDAVGRIYENFLMRDLTYVAGGALLIAGIEYARHGDLTHATDYISQNTLKFVLFLGVSYFVGLVVKEGMCFTKIFKVAPEVPKPYDDYFLLMGDIQKKHGSDVIRRIERIIYLKHVGVAIGSASFISSWILLIPLIRYHEIKYFTAFFVLVVLTLVCLMESRSKLREQNETLKSFAGTMNDT